MRNKMSGSRIGMVMAAGLAALTLTLGVPAFAASDPLVVKNVSVSGGIVLVTVNNASLAPVASAVTVEADVNGVATFSVVPVALLPGQSTVVSAAFTGAVTNVRTVSLKADICDDSQPF